MSPASCWWTAARTTASPSSAAFAALQEVGLFSVWQLADARAQVRDAKKLTRLLCALAPEELLRVVSVTLVDCATD